MWIIKETDPVKIQAVTDAVSKWASEFQDTVLKLMDKGMSFQDALLEANKK